MRKLVNKMYIDDDGSMGRYIYYYTGLEEAISLWSSKIQAPCEALNWCMPPRKINALRLIFLTSSYTKYTLLPYFMLYAETVLSKLGILLFI